MEGGEEATLPFFERAGLVRDPEQQPTCLSKADDLKFLPPVSLWQQPLRGLREALQRGLQSSSGYWPAQGGALAEVQLVQDASLGQFKKCFSVILQVHGGPSTCRT